MRYLRRVAMTMTMAFSFASIGCSDVLPSGPGDSGGDFEVNVSGGSQPVYSWSAGPALDVQVIRVEEPSIFAWRIVDATSPSIQSPVQHGSEPAGTNRIGDAELSLTPSVLYEVRVRLADGDTEGWRRFRP